METKKTSLYQLHQDCNAKFVEFAGYQMPIQYSEGIVGSINLQEITLVFLMFHIWVNYLFMVAMN